MRRQIVIMLLGLMTTLSLSAFAIAGSRESDHAPQPYKYIGKELDRTHGLDWYDHGARHYDPVTGRWNVMDALAEKYYPWSPYVSCGDDPVDAVDIDGDSIFYFKPIIKQREVIGYIPFYCKETNNQYKFYSKNGKCYTGKNVFMGQVLKALKLLSLTPTGKKLINTLLGRKKRKGCAIDL